MLAPKRRPQEPWQEALRFINKCPICAAAYEVVEAKLFAKKGNASLIHITCGQCQSSFMAMILLLGQGLSSVGMVTDLSFADASKFYQCPPITLDEALEGYQFLHTENFINYLKS